MDTRRTFLKNSAGIAGFYTLSSFFPKDAAAEMEKQLKRISTLSPEAAAADDDFWNYIRECYTVNRNLVNLNNGGVAPQPKVVQDAHITNYLMCNEGPSFFMWRILDQGRENLRTKLANLAGCSPEEIAINRNSTEGLNTVIFGLNLKAGDEVVLTKYDYPNMMNAWKQREKRDGIKLTWIDFDFPLEDDNVILKKYSDAITPATKIVHITHMINWTGQLLPAKKIIKLAHEKNCEVIVDGAHTFGHIDYKIPDLGCDYFATSLHKWLCAPFGSGLLYIKKDKIKNVWALLSSTSPDGEDIRKFESLGTRSFASEMAIGNAVDFHEMIGSARKEARLRYLKDYWMQKVAKVPGMKFYTSSLPQYSCAIGVFGLDGWKATEIDKRFYEKYKLHAVAIEYEKLNGVRVTPHVYTSLFELDMLVKAIKETAESRPPSMVEH